MRAKRIGLCDVDGHNWPNLCLMKISAWHKARGDDVEWWQPGGRYDVVYKSRVFTDMYSKDNIEVNNASKVICGGTGYGLDNRLKEEVEHIYPDYGLYPQFAGVAYGFLTRGCFRNCGFCIVSAKEGGQSRKAANLSEFWQGQKEIKLLDANLLACPEHASLLEQLADSGAWVDFTQGLDIRLITPENVELLNRIKCKMLHFAWDNPKEDLIGHFKRFRELSRVKAKQRLSVYVLCNYNSTLEEDLYRIETLKNLGYSPYVMIYNKPEAPPVIRQLQRWVNNRRIFNTVDNFADYKTSLRKER